MGPIDTNDSDLGMLELDSNLCWVKTVTMSAFTTLVVCSHVKYY